MRVLQLGKFYPVRGGVEKVMHDLMLGLAERGVDCDMMCAESAGHGRVRDFDPHARILSFHTWTKVASTTIAPSMVRTLRAVAPDYDVIHVHHPDPMAALALRLSGYKGPVVLHWHADIIKSRPVMMAYDPLQRWLLDRADAIVATSPAIVEGSASLPAYRDKITIIPIGIIRMDDDPAGAAILRDRFGHRKIVFSLGRLVPYKGYSYLVDAAALLPDDFAVVVGGDGPERRALEHQRGRAGLRDRFFLAGRIPDEDIPAYYSACDLFCLPSVMKTEAFGIVQIEAMSLGKPVVATIIEGSGTSWVNAHGVSGLNVPTASPVELARAICTICNDRPTYSRLSAGARLRFESEFTLGLMVDRCLQLYASLL